MKRTQKNVAVTAIISAIAVSSFAFADMMQNNMPVSQQVNNSNMSADQKVSVVASRIDQITTKNVNGTVGGKLPSYLYNAGFNIDIDFIYWRTDVENTAFAVKTKDQTTTTSGQTGSTTLTQETAGGAFDPGFRLQLGYTFANVDMWDMELDWTYFHNTDSNSDSVTGLTAANVGTSGTAWIQPNWGADLTPLYNSSASGSWTLNYNTLDWDIGRNFFISKQISTRIHWGLRAAWLYQKYNYSYVGFDKSGNAGTGSFVADNNFHAVGLRSGADMRWGFNQNWALIGNMSAALLYGRFQTASVVTGYFSNTDATNVTSHNYNFNALRPEIEASFGLEWCAFFYHDKYRFAITALWELQEWFEQNMLTDLLTGADHDEFLLVNSRLNGNMGIQGFTLKFRLDF